MVLFHLNIKISYGSKCKHIEKCFKKMSKLDTLSQNFDDLPHINLIPGEQGRYK